MASGAVTRSQASGLPAAHASTVARSLLADGPFAGYRLVLGGSTALMLVLSRPLWDGQGTIPRVPFLPGLSDPLGTTLGFGALLALILAATFVGALRAWRDTRLARRAGSLLDLLATGMTIALVLADQHRLQPWVYQYILMGLAFAMTTPGRGLSLARWLMVALYVHSGLSKLDVTFARELGPIFLGTLLKPLGVDLSTWPAAWRTAAVLAMPAVELLVGLGLLSPRTRHLALLGAVLMHTLLMGILSPWGLGHSAIVLIWNAAMLAGVLILFRPRPPSVAADAPRPAAGFRERLLVTSFVAATLLPFLERWGLWDTWPSFALYASHGERVEVSIAEEEAERLPGRVRALLGRVDPDGFRSLDLNAWSLNERGTPVYPQVRTMLGLAEGLADSPGRPRRVVARVVGRADRFQGGRPVEVLRGLAAIRRRGEGFLLNAHPTTPRVPDPTTRR